MATSETTLTAESSIRYPELPPELRGGTNWRMLKYFGAGAIVASVTIGSGETLFASRGGAIFGYALMWVLAAGALMKGIQVYTAARYMTLTGEHPMTHWRLFPGPRNWVPVLFGILSVASFPFWIAGLPLALGTMLNWMFGITGSPEELLRAARYWGTANLLAIVVLVWMQSYGVIERTQTVIVGILMVSVVAAVVAIQPDVRDVLSGFIPVIPTTYEGWIRDAYPAIAARPPWLEIVVYLGAVGGGTYDYIGYVGCFREKAWGALGLKRNPYEVRVGERPKLLSIDLDPENVHRARRWLIPAKVDVGVGFFLVLVFTWCFLILGAVILHPQQLVPDGPDLLTHQALFLTGLHPGLLYVYQVGIFFAFWGTVYGAYELYTRTAFESITPISRAVRKVPFRRFRLWIILYATIPGLALMWTFDDPVAIVTPAAIFGGVFACGLWCFFMIWADRKFLARPLRMGRWLLAVTFVSGVFLTFVGARAIWDYAASFLG